MAQRVFLLHPSRGVTATSTPYWPTLNKGFLVTYTREYKERGNLHFPVLAQHMLLTQAHLCHRTHLLDSTTCNNTVWWLDCCYTSFKYISYVASINVVSLNDLSKAVEEMFLIKPCGSCKAGCLWTPHWQAEFPLHEECEPVRPCHLLLIPWLRLFCILYYCQICKPFDLKVFGIWKPRHSVKSLKSSKCL